MAVVQGSSTLQLQLSQRITSGVVTTLNLPASINIAGSYTNGTGANQVDLLYAKALTLAGAAQTLDLTSLTDLNGGAVNFARIREIIIVNRSSTLDDVVTVGAAASNQWIYGPLTTNTSTAVIQAGGYLLFADPITVGASKGAYVDGTHKSLKLDPGSDTIIVDVLIAGCSAAS